MNRRMQNTMRIAPVLSPKCSARPAHTPATILFLERVNFAIMCLFWFSEGKNSEKRVVFAIFFDKTSRKRYNFALNNVLL